MITRRKKTADFNGLSFWSDETVSFCARLRSWQLFGPTLVSYRVGVSRLAILSRQKFAWLRLGLRTCAILLSDAQRL